MNKPERSISIILVLCLGAFAIGRYTAKPAATSTQVSKAAEVDRQTDVQKKTVIVKEPGGKEVTTIVEERKINTEKTSQVTSKTDVHPAKPALHVEALVGYDISRLQVVYGVHAQKEILGPITAGVWGFTNGTVGLSVGLNF